MAKLVFYTQSFNNEKSIASTMDSVLSQTYDDFVYYVADDCSTDNTVAIVREKAAADPRVRVIERKTNGYMKTHHHAMATIMEEHPEALYLAQLDGDDWYREDFAAYCVGKMDAGADLVVTSTESVIEKTPGSFYPAGQRKWQFEDALLDKNQIIERFRYLHVHLRTIWAKMYRLALIKKHKVQHPDMIISGDTIFAYTYLRYADNLYITKELLHKYRTHATSQSYRYDPIRHNSIALMKETQLDTLKGLGNTMQENVDFIRVGCLNDVVDAMMVDVRQLLAHKPLSAPFAEVMRDPVLLDGWEALKEPARLLKVYVNNPLAMRDGVYAIKVKLLRQAEALAQGGHTDDARLMAEFMEPGVATYWRDEKVAVMLANSKFQALLTGGEAEKKKPGAGKTRNPKFDMGMDAFTGMQAGDYGPMLQYLKKFGASVPETQRTYLVQHHPILQRLAGAEGLLNQGKPLELLLSGEYEQLLDYLPGRIMELAENQAETALLLARLGQIVASLMEQGDHYVFFLKAELELLLATGQPEAFLPLWQQWDPLLPGDEEMALLYETYLQAQDKT